MKPAYTLTIYNSGPITATNITITETPPVPITDPAWRAGSNGSYTQVIGELAPSASVTRTVNDSAAQPAAGGAANADYQCCCGACALLHRPDTRRYHEHRRRTACSPAALANSSARYRW